jgi:hypothetical protein
LAYVTQITRCNRKTGTLKEQGRGVNQEQDGNEKQNGNCRRLQKAGKRQKDFPYIEGNGRIHEDPIYHTGTAGEKKKDRNISILRLFVV